MRTYGLGKTGHRDPRGYARARAQDESVASTYRDYLESQRNAERGRQARDSLGRGGSSPWLRKRRGGTREERGTFIKGVSACTG